MSDHKDLTFLERGGEMGALMREKDWASTPLGAPGDWPQGLRTALRLILNSRHPMYVFWGPQAYCFYNDAYALSLGPELHPGSLGCPAQQIWHEIWPIIGPQIDQVMGGGPSTWHEDQLIPITRHGRREEAYWTYSFGPIDDASTASGIGGVLIVCAETTAGVALTRRLAENELLLEQALSKGHGIGTWDWDVVRDRVVSDERFAQLYGVDPKRAAAGAPIAEFFGGIHPDDVPRIRERVAVAIRTGAAFSEEYRLVQPDGAVRWVVAEGRCILSSQGDPIRFPGISFDVTDRKAAERRREALLALTDFARDATRVADLVVTASSLLGNTVGVSRVSYGTIDHDSETLTVERDWLAPGVESLAGTLNLRDYGSFIDDLKLGHFIVIPDVEKDPRTAAAAAALRRRSAAAFVNAPVLERGRLVAVLFLNNAQPRAWLQEDLDLVQQFAERIRNATERLRADEAIRANNDSLEARVAERTRQLMEAEEALRQSQKMEAVGQLTGGIAHDFNNLLAGISGSLELLQSRVSQGRYEAVPRYVDAAQSAAKRATALTQRLLAFSRRQTLDPKPTAVNRLITQIEDLLRRSIGPDIGLEVVGAVGLWPTLIDPNQLENALLNLCINARDAMSGSGRLTIETANKWLDETAARERDLPPGQYVSLCVTDTGTGMSADVAAKAFDPFFTTKPIGQGTGLGLSMIYGFVRQSGGQVRIYSEEGLGTTVCLYLPRYFGEAEQEVSTSGVYRRFEGSPEETVLVVDDEPTVRMLVTEVLQDSGYRVLEAGNGAEAIAILQRPGRLDLLITDVGLPAGMNGRQVADAARVLRPALKVLFITGYAENAVVAHGHVDPGMDIITKPFTIEALGNKVREMVDR